MNLKPEQIPDEAVEAAFDAMRLAEANQFGDIKTPNNGARHECMRHALSAALPVLLGEPVAWGVQFVWEGMGKSEIRMLALYRDEAEGVAYLEQQKISPGIPVSVNAIPLYTLPTPDTPNAHP